MKELLGPRRAFRERETEFLRSVQSRGWCRSAEKSWKARTSCVWFYSPFDLSLRKQSWVAEKVSSCTLPKKNVCPLTAGLLMIWYCESHRVPLCTSTVDNHVRTLWFSCWPSFASLATQKQSREYCMNNFLWFIKLFSIRICTSLFSKNSISL